MTKPKTTKPTCDGCGKDRWFLAHCADRRLCEECVEQFEAQQAMDEPGESIPWEEARKTVPDDPEEENVPDYPTPWRFDSESFVIDRHTDAGGGSEIAMAFTSDDPPDSELLVLILAAMNGWDR